MIPKWSPIDPNMILKWSQHDRKMILKWSQYDPKMILKCQFIVPDAIANSRTLLALALSEFSSTKPNHGRSESVLSAFHNWLHAKLMCTPSGGYGRAEMAPSSWSSICVSAQRTESSKQWTPVLQLICACETSSANASTPNFLPLKAAPCQHAK